jgi:NifU-like protein involved in Fe-S cluster formation
MSRQAGAFNCEFRPFTFAFSLMYSEILKDHLAHPRHSGELADANRIAERTNPVCGDRLRLYLRVSEERIEAARFLAYGCPPTLACGSALTEMIVGMSIQEAMRIGREGLARSLGGLPNRKGHAAALAIETLKAAIESGNYEATAGLKR